MTEPSHLSKKSIPAHERLIVALDVPTLNEAKRLVETLGEEVIFYKLGLELFMSGDYYQLIDWLLKRKKKIFADLKFFDVPETVARAIRQLKDKQVSFVTVHGNDAMLRAAAQEKNGLKILAVTALTSLDQHDLHDLGFQCDLADLVLSRARRALQVGCDGVVSSGLEVPKLREELGHRFPQLLVVVPGIRPLANDFADNGDDQKRISTVESAFRNGADYIVMGRPIRNATNPRATAHDIQERVRHLFSRST